MPSVHLNVVILLALFVGFCTSVAYFIQVVQAIRQLPRMQLLHSTEQEEFLKTFYSKLSVIVPAYNEADNIEDCIRSILEQNPLPSDRFELWVIDDQSTDRTFQILKTLEQTLLDPRLKILCGTPRPEDPVWTGKNWACEQAAKRANGDYLLFLDADIRLKPGAILTLLKTVAIAQLDLISCIPTIVCGSLIEWLVQPLIFINAMVAFNSAAVRDPTTPTTFALGPCMLFRSVPYRAIGGHAAVAAAVAEDVFLARNIKRNGFRLQQFLASDIASLRMYRNWQSLWEGWTKVLYVGANCNPWMMLLLMTVMLLVYTLPWLVFLLLLGRSLIGQELSWIELSFTGLLILLQHQIRSMGGAALGIPCRYCWLQSVGGLLVAIFGLASWIKTETGWGWTWRGRSLKLVKKI